MAALLRANHPVLFALHIIFGVVGATAGLWRLVTGDSSTWASRLFFACLAGVLICFLLMVRRDPEGRL